LTWRDQAILLVLTVLVANTKEAAWICAPSAALLALVRSGDLKRVALRFALPAAYLAWHAIYILVSHTTHSPDEIKRVLSGDPVSNLSAFADYLTGAPLPVLAIALAAALLAAAARPASRWLLVWAVLSFAGAIAIPLRTTAQSPFYLLVPMFYLTMLLALAFAAAAAPRLVALRSAVAIAGLCLLTVQVSSLVRRYSYYAARAEMSRNFQAVLAAVRAQLGERRPELVTFQYPAGNHQAYMFTGSTGEHSHALARYISPPGADERDIAALRRIIRDAEAEKATAPRKGEMIVLLRADLSLERLAVTE
jgi:4-amino-4-deoxy-L-arabinose transferase-like glycosyltransferase